MTKTIDLEKETKKLTEKLLSLLNVEATVVVSEIESKEKEKSISVEIETKDESGLLIGAHGINLNAIQSFLALTLRQKTGEWIMVSVDVGQWRARHEDYLNQLAVQASDRARLTKEPQYLYNLTPAQRRIIHMHLSSENDITTESEGEGENRYLIVKVK
ncbi:hypothetical protein A2382_04340 [Candidatus Woesebacteria bacterium RIFOXYB1_FULL_38_16]|uniref:R3H domain-containing protein n=1 Tax=Candidatus Woesebacteria bacterium RIFOXYB1_FULL_38_16 TaxID=1802538 RepID=A0A1F8CVF1_9BACT|nr:MAG: hypothetical protein A2191_04420 [Candidatus Woesebacteria bacterium RIFOXYA1_FULL_38_9]OGM79799.1 MAG: hypothetical protein A2382_04340 [Candidatus Woesebacteria bacterium RIFOXYB1_FULL_38_16]